MNNLWTTGIQRFMLCPQCGPMSPWWGSTICAVVGYDFHHMRKKCGVPGPTHCSPALAAFAAALWGNWAGMVFGGGKGGEALYQQVQSTWGWYEGWSQDRIGVRGESGRRLGTVYGGYVSLVPHCSFVVRKESLRASMTRSERKSMLYRYSFLEVNKMCQLAERKRGSKSRMLLLAHSCQSLHWTLTISCWRRSESRGCVDSRESLSLFRLFTMIGLGRLLVFLFVCGGGVVFLVLLFDVLDLSVVSFVYLSQLTLRYNACHYRDDERSISPKKSVSQDITASVFFYLWYLMSSVLPSLWSNAPLVRGISNPMASLRRFSFLRAPLMDLSSLTLFRGGLICFRICLINSLIVLANDCECFCCFSRTWNCPFRVVVADWRASRPGHVPKQLAA